MNIVKTRSELLLGKTIFDMNLNVGYYARVSTDKDDQLNSLENQSNYFKEMITENKNWNLVGEYIDEGISGTSIKNRDNFLRMIEDSKTGKLDLIVTKEISRFSRSVIDSIKYTEELLNNGTVVFFISDNINTIYPDSEFRLTLMSSLAQDEVRKLSERVKFGIKRMIKDGKVIGGNLTGYYRKNGKMIVNEEERPIIETLFNLYVTGKYSFEKIADILYKKGYKNKNGKVYSGTTLKKFLTNPRYKGYYTANLTKVESYKTHKKIKVPKEEHIIYKTDLIEPIVSEELWDKANLIYEKKYKARNTHIIANQKVIDESKYTFKLICNEHNEIFVRCAGSNRRSNPTWVCKKYKNEGVLICESPIIREKKLDELMKNIINNHIKEYLRDVANEMIKLYNEVLIISNNKLKINLKNRLEELISHKDKLINLNLSKIISDDDLKNKLTKNELEISKINSELENIKDDIDISSNINDIEKEIKNILNIKYNLNVFINLLLDKIIVTKLDNRYKMNLKIYFKGSNVKEVLFEN